MNIQRLAAACAAALVTCVTLGCKDVPLLPKWDADWNVPLPSQRIGLLGPFPATITSGMSANVSFPPQPEPLDGAIGQLLRDTISSAGIVMVVTKSVAVDGQDTLFVAATTADLTNAAAQRIVVPVTVVAASAKDSVSTAVTSGGLAMLQSVARASGSLQVQLRGRVTYNGSIRTITASDSIGVRLALLATVAMSR